MSQPDRFGVVKRMSTEQLVGLVLEADEIMGKTEVLLAVGMQIMARLAPEGKPDPEVERWCREALAVLGPPEEILARMPGGGPGEG